MNEVTFRVDRYDNEDNVVGYTEHVCQTEGCLQDMVDNFKDFLVGMTFTYVEQVIAIKEGGDEVASEQ